jgi:hypothetical protein
MIQSWGAVKLMEALIFCSRHRKVSGNMENLDATRKLKIFQPMTVGLHLRRGECLGFIEGLNFGK